MLLFYANADILSPTPFTMSINSKFWNINEITNHFLVGLFFPYVEYVFLFSTSIMISLKTPERTVRLDVPGQTFWSLLHFFFKNTIIEKNVYKKIL